MNNPDDIAVDTEEMRFWANSYRDSFVPQLSWSIFAQRSGIAASTIQAFCSNKYLGKNDSVAKRVFRFKQLVETQADRSIGIPNDPGFIETPTSDRVMTLLTIAQMGRMTIGAMGPGTGKTRSAKRYQECNANVWRATMKPSCKTLNTMLAELSSAVGQPLKTQYSRGISRQIMDAVRLTGGLIIIDEAQHLDTEALEEIRSLHDETSIGICLLGNEELLMRIEAGHRRDAFARLNSRIAQRHIQNFPTEGDVMAFCDAWQIGDPGMRALLTKTALTPGAGGLRECQMLIEAGSLLAMDEDRPLSLGDLRDAQSTRATRNVRS